MRLSTNFTKTSRDFPSDETSRNAQLLIKAGFIHKAMAGVYAYLPLGLRVLGKIENIVRKNMNKIGGQEILMNSLHPKIWWDKTDRWDADKVDVLFRLESQTKSQYALACSHEEQVVPIVMSFASSYRDLPDYVPKVSGKVLHLFSNPEENCIAIGIANFSDWVHLKKLFVGQKVSLILTSEGSSIKHIKIIKIEKSTNSSLTEYKEYDNLEINIDYIRAGQQILIEYEKITDSNFLNPTFPLSVYQIQTKFRDELRSKSGIMRGREFRMKDMYDFHLSQESADNYYELVKQTYFQIFTEMGLVAFAVHASGGMFTNNDSHEFQVICEAGEDEIFYDLEDESNEKWAVNAEVLEELKEKNNNIPQKLQKAKSAEVGNIFKLGDKYTKSFDFKVANSENKQVFPIMNCHGIGVSRCMGVIAEIYSDEMGLKWPESVTPFQFHIISGSSKNSQINQKIQTLAKDIYNGELKLVKQNNQIKILNPNNLAELSKFVLSDLQSTENEILWDDRENISIGQKLKDADLIGCPHQIIITEKSLENGGIEIKNRTTSKVLVVQI